MRKPTTTALVKWDDELAKDAKIASATEASAGGGQFYSVRGSVFSFNDVPLPNNEGAFVIVDNIFENVYYQGAFDASTPAAPTCFAYARNEGDLAPHAVVVEAGQQQHPTCKGCPQNEFGSSERGRGKACSNRRRLALIPAGDFVGGRFKLNEDPEHFQKVAIGFLRLPPTSIKGYANFVQQITGALQRPPHGVVTKISVQSDPNVQLRVLFEPLAKIPDALMPAVMQRRQEAHLTIDQPYAMVLDNAPASGARIISKPTRAPRAAKVLKP